MNINNEVDGGLLDQEFAPVEAATRIKPVESAFLPASVIKDEAPSEEPKVTTQLLWSKWTELPELESAEIIELADDVIDRLDEIMDLILEAMGVDVEALNEHLDQAWQEIQNASGGAMWADNIAQELPKHGHSK